MSDARHAMTKIIVRSVGLSVDAVAAEAAAAYDDAYGMTDTDDGLPPIVYRPPHNRVRGNSRRYPEFWFGSRRTE